MIQRIGSALFLLCFSSEFAPFLYADQFHYRNFLIGDRAIGLGGAYTAISDDASSVYYNPAGAAFALNNDLSGSANAFYQKKVTYKQTVGDNDFTEHSTGSVPSFFGGLQKLDAYIPGLVFSFGVFFNNSELKDQNDTFSNVTLDTPSPCTTGGVARNSNILQNFQRNANERSSSLNVSGAFAYRVSPKIAIGFALNYLNVDELVQEYQDVRIYGSACDSSGNAQYYSTVQTQNLRQHLYGYGLQPVLSMQAQITERLSWGLTLKSGMYFKQHYDQESETRVMQVQPTDQILIDIAAKTNTRALISNPTALGQSDRNLSSNKALGMIPLELGTGIAFFQSHRFLLSFDLNYVSSVKNMDSIQGLGKVYEKQSVLNLAGGLEYYLLSALPLRLGVFTNNDARPQVKKNQVGQRDHIDYTGESLFLAWVQANSQLGAGVILQQGRGKAQKVVGSEVIQTVIANSFTFAISASHSL